MHTIISRIALWLGAVYLTVQATFVLAAPALLTITSPASGNVVHAGDIITVSVVRTPNSGINQVAVYHGGWTEIKSGPDPLDFNITIPSDSPPGPISLVAFNMDLKEAPGTSDQSTPLLLQVESSLTMSSLVADFNKINFGFVGDQMSLGIAGLISTGTAVRLNDSKNISYTSDNTSIAAVDETGNVSAVGSGNTIINITYTNLDGSIINLEVPVSVPVSLKGDFNKNRRVDNEDVSILRRYVALGATAITNNDARDVNEDGKIDGQDVEVLQSLCTLPNCATMAQPNHPPIANAGVNLTIECKGSNGTSVALNGTDSYDPDGDTLTFSWTGRFGTASGPTPSVLLPLGVNPITLTLDDGHGATATAQITDTVVDTTQPTVNAALVPLDKVERERGMFRVQFSCSDICDTNANVSATLNGTAVSNGQLVELDRDNDGKTEFKKGTIIFEAPTFSLDAVCTDASGNKGMSNATPVFKQRETGLHTVISNLYRLLKQLGMTIF